MYMKKKGKAIFVVLILLLLFSAVRFNLFNRGINYFRFRVNEIIRGHKDAKQILAEAGEYDGEIAVVINDNHPFFHTEDLSTVYSSDGRITSYESYSKLDLLGRCQAATALIGKDLMPTDDREPILSVKPSGWYVLILPEEETEEGYIYLYNRCHLIAFCLTGENDNERNLITGCRAMNLAMKDYEVKVASYIERTGNHVLYRVTPLFEGMDALCTGVLMEAYSIEDQGNGICFCVFLHNVQPLLHGSVTIDYTDGSAVYNKGNK